MCLLYIVTILMDRFKQVGNTLGKTVGEGQTMLEKGARTTGTALSKGLTNLTETTVKGATSAAKTAAHMAKKITPEVVKTKLAGTTSVWERLKKVPNTVKKVLGFSGGRRTKRKMHGGRKRKSRIMRKKRRSTYKK